MGGGVVNKPLENRKLHGWKGRNGTSSGMIHLTQSQRKVCVWHFWIGFCLLLRILVDLDGDSRPPLCSFFPDLRGLANVVYIH